MRYCVVHELRKRIVVAPFAATVHKVFIIQQPLAVLSTDADDAALGGAVLEALSHWRTDIPHPEFGAWDRELRPFLRAFKIRSWSEFSRRGRIVGVEHEESSLKLVPQKRESHEGYTRLEDRTITLPPDASPEAIGRGVREALALCV